LIISLFQRDFPIPLLAAQILWVNLVTDGFPYIALTAEPGDPEIMKEKPRSRKEPILNYESKLLIFLISLFTAAVTLLAFWFYWHRLGDVNLARTVAFNLLALSSLIYVFSARNLRHSIFHKNFFSNKYLFLAFLGGLAMQALAVYTPFFQRIFKTVSLGVMDWVIIVLGSAAVIFMIEVIKYIFLVRKKK